MQDLIDKILVVINECKDPINNTTSRTLRDDMLEILGRELFNISRSQVESYAKNEKELYALSWFYTRFIHNRSIGANGSIRSNKL